MSSAGVAQRKTTSRHAATVVARDQGGSLIVRLEQQRVCAGIEGVRDDLRQDCFLERARICIPQILEEVDQIDTCFAQGMQLLQQ